MNFKEYQEKASRTLAVLPDPLLNQLHMVVGMVTEASELADAYKKHFAYGKELDIVNVEEEIGDLLWFIVNYCEMMKLDISSIMHKNISKLEARYPDKFNQENAINRDLVKERNILNQQ